jgi:HD-GYP domain-containing protein (c-di-GMP phosphodiesterase class II)
VSSNPAAANQQATVLSIPSSTVIPNIAVDFSVYYKNSANQYKKLINTGNHCTHRIKQHLDAKRVEKLFIRYADKPKYLDYLKRAKSVPAAENTPSAKITRIGHTIAPQKPQEINVGFIQKKTADMEKIAVEKIKGDTVVDFPVFYRGSDNAVKKLLTKGNTVTEAILELIARKKPPYLFIKKEDKEAYRQYVQNNTPPFTLDPGLSLGEKARAVSSHATAMLENLFKDPRCAWSFARIKGLIEYTVDIILSDKGAIKAFTDVGTTDYTTSTHSFDVGVFAIGFGHHLGLSIHDLRRIGFAGIFHDIGKSKIDPAILDKEGPLDADEFEIVKKHSLYSNFILKSHVEKDKDILDAVKHHHEHFDGSGYPQQLKGNEIPIFAQIISIVDAYDAISSSKSYRDAYNSFETLNMMKSDMGSQFDKRLLMEFIKFMGPQY